MGRFDQSNPSYRETFVKICGDLMAWARISIALEVLRISGRHDSLR